MQWKPLTMKVVPRMNLTSWKYTCIISDDTVQDQDSVPRVQQQGYLNHINYTVGKMHEFTDGCAAQYKSRHCVAADFGYTIQRNPLETSQAKGEQDAAGSCIKKDQPTSS